VPRYPFDSHYIPYPPAAQQSSNLAIPNTTPPQQPTSPTASRRKKPPPTGVQATAILFGRGARHYRDDDDAKGLVVAMRREVAVEWAREFGDAGERILESGSADRGVVEGEAKVDFVVKRVDKPRENDETDASLGLAAKKGSGRGGGRL
jgi:hypothetical protein